MRLTTKGHVGLTALLTAAAMVLGGCFSVESNFTINDDGTADIEIITLIDTEQLSEFTDLFGLDDGTLDGLGGADLLDEITQGTDPCADVVGSLSGFEAEVTEIDNGTEVGVGCTVSGVPIDDLNSVNSEGSSFSIEQDEAGTRVSLELQGVDELTQGADDLPGFLDINIDELFSIVFTVTAPGSLGDNNATSTSGATASWDVTADAAFVSGGDATMTAEWTPGGGSDSNWWMILLVIAAIVAVIVVIAVLIVKRRRSTASPSDDTTAAAPPSSPPGSPPPPSPPPPSPPPPPPSTAPPATAGPPATAAPPPPPPTGESPPAPPDGATQPPPPPPT